MTELAVEEKLALAVQALRDIKRITTDQYGRPSLASFRTARDALNALEVPTEGVGASTSRKRYFVRGV